MFHVKRCCLNRPWPSEQRPALVGTQYASSPGWDNDRQRRPIVRIALTAPGRTNAPQAITIIPEQLTKKTLMADECYFSGIEGRRPDSRTEQAVCNSGRLAYCELPLLTMCWAGFTKGSENPTPLPRWGMTNTI